MPRLKASLCPAGARVAVRCRVAAHAAVRLAADELNRLRREPLPAVAEPLPASFLKHAEDQSVAAVTAVRRAIAARGWDDPRFGAWGAVAAVNFFGRQGIAQTIQRYAQEGPWAVSPHLIPQHSFHAASGVISQVWRMHGPNFGAGGGPCAATDAFLFGAAVLAERRVPGIWLVLTGHESELLPPANDQTPAGTGMPRCEAAALALMPETSAGGVHVRVCPEEPAGGREAEYVASLAPFSLSALVDELMADLSAPAAAWRLPGCGWVELETRAAGGEDAA
jgi:hypothetical protein